VPVQGSGTFAVEAMITTFVPKSGKLLVLINGAYGQRARKIGEIAGRAVVVHETPEDRPPDLAALDACCPEIRPSRMSSPSIARRPRAS
jgi:2-aminoethylphosphonate-pyruvate transaminase